jgi:branched-chain amino acid aminotransferase
LGKWYDGEMQTNIDWKNLSFRLTPAKTMYVAKTGANLAWDKGEFVPYGPISMSPAAGILNYGQGIIEGLKAFRTAHDDVVLFRPQENAIRFARGAVRMCMPPVSPEKFLEVMIEIVRRNQDYLPPIGLGTLYLRPCLWGTGEILGVAAAPEYCFAVYASPVGNYFKSGEISPVKFIVCENFHRSASRGVGGIKYIGNYAPTILPMAQAKKAGFAGSIFLDPVHEKYVEEAGMANFFCVKDNKLLTPQLSESILSGVTRSSVIQLAREILNLEVSETRLSIETALQADECFCSGTAAVITPIGSITYKGRETVFDHSNSGPITRQLYDLLVKIQQGVLEDPFGWLVRVN